MGALKLRLKPGDLFHGRYRIEGVVGRGGMGAIFRATDLETSRAVALKVLLNGIGTTDIDRKRFRREATTVQSLTHPNVVELLAFGEDDRATPFIAFELLDGTALGDHLEQHGPLEFGHALRVGKDVLRALAAAHARGIIHRDIKPQNVFLLGEAPFTKVLDFGIAKAVGPAEGIATQLTESGDAVGTPQYMAPEQVRGEAVHPSTDLYALGLVLAEALTGERVVAGTSVVDVYLSLMSTERLALDPRLLASPVGELLVRATSKNSEERYRSATTMLRDLERIVVEPGYALRPPTKTRPMGAREHADANATSAIPTSAPQPSARVPAPASMATVIMEDPEAGVTDSGDGARPDVDASPSVRAMRRLGADVSALPSQRSTPSMPRERLLSSAAEQPQPAGIWSQGSQPRLRPMEAFDPSSMGPFGQPAPSLAGSHVPAAPSTPTPRHPAHKALRLAVGVVFVLLALCVAFGVWLLIGGA